MDRNDPNQWTASFARTNTFFCLSFLQDTNRIIIECLRRGDCEAAVAGIDRMLNGAIALHNAGVNMRPFLATNSFSQGMIIACGLHRAPDDKRRETAIAAFSDACDFSKADLGQCAREAIDLLRSVRSFTSIQRELCPRFPEDVIDLLADNTRRLESMK